MRPDDSNFIFLTDLGGFKKETNGELKSVKQNHLEDLIYKK